MAHSRTKSLPLPNFGNVGGVGMDKFWEYVSELNSYAQNTTSTKLLNDQFLAFNNYLAVKDHQINSLVVSLVYAATQSEQDRITQDAQLANITEQKARCAALEKIIAQQKRRIASQGEHLDAQSSILGAKLAEENRLAALKVPVSRKRGGKRLREKRALKSQKISVSRLTITFDTDA